jgi:hypothetical protein
MLPARDGIAAMSCGRPRGCPANNDLARRDRIIHIT